MMKQFDIIERITEQPGKLTVIVSGKNMTLIAPNRETMTYHVPLGFQNELLCTMRRRDTERLGRLLDRLDKLHS